MERPIPTTDLIEAFEPRFVPAPEIGEWVKDTFLNELSPLWNVEHDHLRSLYVGFLWTNIENSRHMRRIVGQAEIPFPQGGKWQKERTFYQLAQWFGTVPDFVVTLDAKCAAQAEDDAFCALLEHELYHCGQAIDKYGFPKFTKEGKPKPAIKGHDAEEFVGIVRRYGVGAAAGGVAQLVEVARLEPEIARVDITAACGTCLSR